MKNKNVRKIYFYRSYYLNFYGNLSPSARNKFDWTLILISSIDRVPTKFLAHLTGTNGLFEIRVKVDKCIYRVFCFFDQGDLIILLNVFQKKTRKTPRKEIEKAETLKEQYFNEKNNK